jgi:hypothetical protein
MSDVYTTGVKTDRKELAMMETITGTFSNVADAQAAVEELMAKGWTRESISLLTAQPHHPHLAVKDAEKGAVIGGLAGLFLGLSEVAVPGVGLVLVGGWLAASLLGAGMGAAAGGLGGVLAEFGLSHAGAGRLAERIKSGEILVSVREKTGNTQLVQDVFSRHHATHIQGGV